MEKLLIAGIWLSGFCFGIAFICLIISIKGISI